MMRGRFELVGHSAASLLLALVIWALAGCNQLDPIKTTNLCDSAGDISENCPQCLTSPIAPGCPQCRSNDAPAGCFEPQPNETGNQTGPQTGEGTSGTGGEATGGAEPTSGAGAANGGNAGRSGNRAPQGGNATPTNGGAGTTGTVPGGAAGVGTGPKVPALNNCLDGVIKCDREGARVCLATGQCGECSEPDHCPGRACDTVSARCVDCMGDQDCADDGKVCLVASRTCIECRTSPDCKQDGLRACDTQKNICVECVDGASPNGCQDPAKSACLMQKCVQCTSDANCGGTTPRCVVEVNECVECKQSSDCRSDAKKTVCFEDENKCVECNADTDCKDPNASHCSSNHTCEPCTATDQCKHIPNLNACDTKSHKCVECVDGSRTCGSNACILSTNKCSTVAYRSRGLCQECQSSTECSSGECVRITSAAANKDEGGRCLVSRIRNETCGRPNTQVLSNMKSLDGTTVSVCAPPSRTSCEALVDAMDNKPCPGGSNTVCGWGAGDGFCYPDTNTCTTTCADSNECPNPKTCMNGTCK